MLSTVIIRALTVCVAVYIAKIAMDIIITTGWFYKVNCKYSKARRANIGTKQRHCYSLI